ncbi:MAG: hypothetical protein KF850_25705 [Labilithrix sp.]|nr:hypothetical protein [Labilithrix sp.]
MRRAPLPFLLGLGLVVGCDVDTAPEGLRRTPEGTGPLVKFDTSHRPLPEVPLPNDVATFADPTSRTGVRVNVSLVAPTHMERRAREDFASMEGWGVSSPITVAFERGAATGPLEPAIDLDAVADRMTGDEHDPANDPFYVVNLTTGIPVPVDVESGYYPVVLRDPFRYGPNDPKASESNLVFETVEEGAGLPQSAYRPELDRDFDGVLDHPNTRPRRRSAATDIPGVDDIITWYERESDTLILRPLVPLDEKTEYAVVLTDRLRGPDGQPVRSPFEAIHHPTQRAGVARLRDWLGDQRLAGYYGDIAGTGLDHVAFTWTFTTQPTHEDMRLLRDGLYGKGPFARWKDQYPPDVTVARIAGTGPANEEQPAGWEASSPACGARAKTPFILKLNDEDLRGSFRLIFEQVFGLDKGGLKAVEDALQHIDHVVLGSFESPFLMGDPASRDPGARFGVSFVTGEGDVRTDDVQWVLVVPKAKGEQKQPFPVAFFGHGVTGHADETLLYGGDFARQGIALIGYNNPGHGLVLGEGDQRLAKALLGPSCVTPFFDGVLGGRARDLNGDGVGDSGWFWWTSHIFHTRDNVRQGILDGMNLVRILRSFDGRRGTQDLTGDGAPEIAGDFDGDGVPDVGGPNVSYFAAGESLGGIMSDIQGGIEPYMIASAPMSGGGGLAMDVALRSYGVVESVTAQLMGPVVFSVPAAERPPRGDDERIERIGSRCGAAERTLRLQVNEGVRNQELELACLGPEELSAGMTVVVTNVTSREVRCARTGKDGRFRVPIPTSTGDKLDVQVYTAPDVVASYDGCRVTDGAPLGRRVRDFEQAALKVFPVADSESSRCDEAEGCQQFRDRFFPVGTPLVAPNEGLGVARQTPAMRRFRDLAQAALDPGDPIAFAPYYMLKPLFDEHGQRVPPHALLTINTVGDNFVQVSSHLAFARAAGAVPFLPPSAVERLPAWADYATPHELYDRLGRRTPMQFLVDSGVAEGIARLGRTSAGPACRANYSTADADLCTQAPVLERYECMTALYDADWISEGRLPYDQPHPDVPLRLARVAGVHVTDSTSLAAAWEPRLRGVPFGPDESSWAATERVVGLFNHYLVPKGQHTWSTGDACRAWDFAVYGNALTARFFASGGRDVYYLSHPKTHACLADGSCDFFR